MILKVSLYSIMENSNLYRLWIVFNEGNVRNGVEGLLFVMQYCCLIILERTNGVVSQTYKCVRVQSKGVKPLKIVLTNME